jgi:hypothetical protein
MADQMPIIQESVTKKKRKTKGKGCLMDIYNLQKVKVNLEIEPSDNKLRGVATYILNLKTKEEIDKHFNEA